MASSLVGEIITAIGLPISTGILFFKMSLIMGRRKAAVLPDPVWEQAIKSRFAIPMAMPCRCTGVGRSYFINLINTSKIRECSPLLLKSSIGGGTSSPVTFTFMLSYALKLVPDFMLLSNSSLSLVSTGMYVCRGGFFSPSSPMLSSPAPAGFSF